MIKEVEKYKAVGEENRLRIIRILLKANIALCVCEIVDILKKPQYTISKHLGILKRTELIRERRDGKMMMYSIIKENELNKKIFDSINIIKDRSVFERDFQNLEARLNLREKGKIVVMYEK